MATQPTKGKKMFAAELPEDLADQFREYARSRGERITAALERAIRREMAYPPAIAGVPPLPDVAGGNAEAAGKGKKGGRRK